MLQSHPFSDFRVGARALFCWAQFHKHYLLHQWSKFRTEISYRTPSPRYDIISADFFFIFYEFGNILFKFDEKLFKISDRNFRNFDISAPSDRNVQTKRLNPGYTVIERSFTLELEILPVISRKILVIIMFVFLQVGYCKKVR